MVRVNVFTKQKQTHGHRKQTQDYQRGKRCGGTKETGVNREKLLSYKLDKQQGPSVQHRQPVLNVSCNNLQWKKECVKIYICMKKQNIYIYMHE